MNHRKAFQRLEMEIPDNLDIPILLSEIKQRYRMYALMYHPDKNKSMDASIRFVEIKEAYEYLQKELKTYGLEWKEDILSEDDEEMEIVPSFYNIIMKNVMGSVYNQHKETVDSILDKILAICEKQSINILYKIDLKKIQIIYNIFNKFKHVFGLSEEFMKEMEIIYKKRMFGDCEETKYMEIKSYEFENKKKYQEWIPQKKTIHSKSTIDFYEMDIDIPDEIPIIVLNPNIDHLWENMVFKLKREDQIFLVPLWHHHLFYEYNSREFMVKCILKEEDIYIDEENNIHKEITYSIRELFEKRKNPKIEIHLGNRIFSLDSSLLRICETQTIEWKNQGISKINENIYDITEKSNIYLHIFLIY